MQVINTEKKLIKSWCNTLEESALLQAKNLANLPFLFKHLALMPDCHAGFGMPIGGVAALRGVVSPSMVGVDIGCGMHAVQTNLTELDTDTLKKIMGKIRETVPVGFNHHKAPQLTMEEMYGDLLDQTPIVGREAKKSLHQLGTLGGGNHFIEIQRGSDGYIWFMIHSGSRNLGKQVADHYNKLAVNLNERWHSSVPKQWELAFLPIESREAQLYFDEMTECLRFAKRNRFMMGDRISDAFNSFTGCEFTNRLDVHHNYAAWEHHFNTNVLIHRKGATSAKEGELGIIPGSQGTASYIVKGKGNTESFTSCSHGAGRKFGRKQACKTLNLDEEKKRLDDLGVVHSIRNESDLDEAAGAYKDIDTVMAEQADLVDIVVKLEPMGVIKG